MLNRESKEQKERKLKKAGEFFGLDLDLENERKETVAEKKKRLKAELREKYLKLSKKYHPDKLKLTGAESEEEKKILKEKADEDFKRLVGEKEIIERWMEKNFSFSEIFEASAEKDEEWSEEHFQAEQETFETTFYGDPKEYAADIRNGKDYDPFTLHSKNLDKLFLINCLLFNSLFLFRFLCQEIVQKLNYLVAKKKIKIEKIVVDQNKSTFHFFFFLLTVICLSIIFKKN